MSLARKYDAINAAIFLSAGGSRRVRRRFVDTLDLRAGHRVLEIGCGTGQVTEVLVESGADVLAVDALPDMLEAARRRAPSATFVEADAATADLGAGFDRIVLSFVLHNFDADGRTGLLRRAGEVLTGDGCIGILDWAEPPGQAKAALWRRFLAFLEPSASVPQILDGALDTDALSAGLDVRRRRPIAGGRAQILVLQRHSHSARGRSVR